MPEQYVRANGIRLAYEEFGHHDHPAIILMMGLGTQLIDTARHIPGATLKLFDGMGHDLPEPLIPEFVSLISTHAHENAA